MNKFTDSKGVTCNLPSFKLGDLSAEQVELLKEARKGLAEKEHEGYRGKDTYICHAIVRAAGIDVSDYCKNQRKYAETEAGKLAKMVMRAIYNAQVAAGDAFPTGDTLTHLTNMWVEAQEARCYWLDKIIEEAEND